MSLTPTISRTRTTIYDTDLDFDTEADRVDHIKTEEVLAYVPTSSPHWQAVMSALTELAKDLNSVELGVGSGNPPATP